MKVLRVGLLVLFAGAVLAFGAVDVWSQSLLEAGAAALFVLWAALAIRNPEMRLQWSPLNWPLLALIGIGLMQLLFRATAAPFLTRVEALKFAAYFLIFFLAAQAFRTRRDFTLLAWFLMLLCFAVSLQGITQHFTSSNDIYWTDAFSIQTAFFGPYVNRNHFAGFVELTLPTGLAVMAFRCVRRDVVPLIVLLTLVPVSALVLSGSRSGIVGLVFELAVLALLVRSRSGRRWKAPRIMAAGAIALIALALIVWVGAGLAIQRFSLLNVHDVPLDRRTSMARGAAHIFRDYPLKGAGLGTLVDVYPRYDTVYDGRLVDHVHNDYLEGLAETGALGGLCGVFFLWALYRESRKAFAPKQAHISMALHAAGIAAIAGLLFHSLVDFNLHIPANALLFLLQVFIATSPPLPPSASRRSNAKSRKEVSIVYEDRPR
jgi:O-antigen ligase